MIFIIVSAPFFCDRLERQLDPVVVVVCHLIL
jgi:hypothetical protein